MDDKYDSSGFISWECAQAIKVDATTLECTKQKRLRFQRAMRILDLKPSAHTGQDHGRLVAAQKSTNDNESNSSEDTKAKDRDGS